MKIGVVGLWHLGTVYSACLADLGNQVIAIDEDEHVVSNLSRGQLPVQEPGLQELVLSGIEQGNLYFSSDFTQLNQCDLVWITLDTPVDENDVADYSLVEELIYEISANLKQNAFLAISSQLPAGTTERISNSIEKLSKSESLNVIYIPENLRLGQAISSFRNQSPWIIGTATPEISADAIGNALNIEKNQMLLMSPLSAEFVKHSINSFLAISVIFANEISRVSWKAGANPVDVMEAVMSDPRIGKRAYLKPGKPIEGGTLARDVNYLQDLATEIEDIPGIANILPSNEIHKEFILERIRTAGKVKLSNKIAVLGLGYKPGSSTLRRSHGIEIAESLLSEGYEVFVFDEFLTEQTHINPSFNILECIEDATLKCDVLYWNLHEEYIAQPEFSATTYENCLLIDGNNLFKDFEKIENIRKITQ